MNKFLKLTNFLYISALMVIVVGLLIANLAKESIVSLLEKKKSTILTKNKIQYKQSTKYLITNKHKINA